MSKVDDLEKNQSGLPDLSDIYGGVEDNRTVGGVAEHSDPVASSSPSDLKGTGSSGSWFTKKRIIIIAVVAVIVVAGAVGGGVGGALAGKKSSDNSGNSSSPSDGGPSGSQTTSGAPSQTSVGSNTDGSSNGGSGGTPTTTIVPANAAATGIILPSGVTAVAFSGVPKPASTGTPLEINLGFPGLTRGFELSAGNLVKNGDFKQNLTGWENADGCWDAANWDDKGFRTAWVGKADGPIKCELAQTMSRGADQGKDTDYVASFLYRNSVAASSEDAQLWAYIGDNDQMLEVLATKEGKPTSSDGWSKAAYKYTVKANKQARIVFKGFNNGEYWEVSQVQVLPLELLST